MRRSLLVLALVAVTPLLALAQGARPAPWKAKVDAELPLLGHRNWILIVDSAYPLQTSPGVETVETNADELDVVRYVLNAVHHAIHVRPEIYMDAELPYVPDTDAPGASAYRQQMAAALHGHAIESLPHDQIIANIDDTGRLFHVLILKTSLTIPYSSVFIRLNCKYWSDDAENRLRARMAEASGK